MHSTPDFERSTLRQYWRDVLRFNALKTFALTNTVYVLLSTVPDTPDVPAKRQRFASTRLTDCIVYETSRVNATNNVELRKLYYSVLDYILREMSARFNERNSKLARALVSLDPKSDTFLDAKASQPQLLCVKARSQRLKTFSGRTGGQWSSHVKQWFSTGVPRKTSVPWKIVRCSAGNLISLTSVPSNTGRKSLV